MMSKKMLDALNEQIALELSSAYLYLAMGAQLDDENLPGFAHWMKVQFQEETEHGMKLFDYVADRGGRVTLEAIPKPQTDFGSPADIFKAVLEHERKVTASIHRLYELALAEKDYATQAHLQWFITEQVEEEKNAEGILRQIQAMEGKAHLMLMLDRHLGARKAD
ncbi:MAG: ferritin [Phycisphaerae bacterium]|nr:ferritin [Phycisphaerae bacterium]